MNVFWYPTVEYGEISMSEIIHKKRKLTTFQLIVLGFAGVILLGALLLMLPISSRDGVVTSFRDALFTATSAVCVTGLVVKDTGSYWSSFGQAVILLLIQTGGLGVITVATTFSMLSGRKISLMQRSTMQSSISAPRVGGIVKLTRFILKGTFLIEFVGMLLLMPVFCRDYGLKGIWLSLFHSVSAFCNGGFDILGTRDNLFPSLTGYAGDPLLNITIMLLIVIGGIGFLTWDDVCIHRWHVKRYSTQSKVVLFVSALLILIPAGYFFFCDFYNFPIKERVLISLFQSVTTRTAGFNTADYAGMSEVSKMLVIMLMLVGGSPGSTAGGMKTTTLAVLVLNAIATFYRKEDTEVYGRRLEVGVVKNAATILTLYLFLFLTGGMIISLAENLPLSDCLFETASAVGTAGLTLGITPMLGGISQVVLIVLMYLGRVGGLTLIYATFSGTKLNGARYPVDKMTVG